MFITAWTFFAVAALTSVNAQVSNSFPRDYPGKPSGDYSPQWQKYFQVTDKLPNVTWDLGRNWAGNIAVNRSGHPNDTLFFWAFEKENGSLTAAANERAGQPWGIWLNGGPGASSLIGLMSENGPLHVTNTYSIVQNNFSWSNLADYIWIDQPVGTGFATADTTGYNMYFRMYCLPLRLNILAQLQTRIKWARISFMAFLTNLVKVFPSLASRPLYLTGESYAGTYIVRVSLNMDGAQRYLIGRMIQPYITKTYFSTPNPPVKLAKIAIGDGAIASGNVFEDLPALSVIETYPQLISYDPNVYNYFKEQTHLCGYDLNLTYPQNGIFPSLKEVDPTERQRSIDLRARRSLNQKFFKSSALKAAQDPSHVVKRDLMIRDAHNLQNVAKRDLSGRANGTIDPWYGCFLFPEMVDYATNFSFPWNTSTDFNGFDVYDVPDALDPEAPADPSVFLNDNATRAALHAPIKQWQMVFNYPFNSTESQGNTFGDPSPEPMVFLSELAKNATNHNISVVIYSGNDDSLVPHRGSEVTIQNTTFGGIQGFVRKPSTPWNDDAGNFAGIVHQERNWTYVLFKGAGHEVPLYAPNAAFKFLRDFVLGSDPTGLVTNSSGTITVVGSENSTLAGDYLPGGAEIFYGSGTTASTATYPAATIAAWNSFIATATATTGSKGTSSGAGRITVPREMIILMIGLISGTFCL
ncbi:alpha/beta-hydrolase [Rickenella mellea]|uniref:Carboxypeptidase n=1 Tax=Rickenella mellea TaxID=50990 RepID=A0A4Y7PLG1_9AGAM|nr:alpha/beta-hydrolase [Rickenella mellea]